jgi:hypothetical protein
MENPLMLEQPQMTAHFASSQDAQQILPQFQQAWNQFALQQSGQQLPMAPGQYPLQMPQSQMQVPQTHMQQMDSSTELHRCMAIIMPETAQFPCDKNVVAAQLQAAADCQCYED